MKIIDMPISDLVPYKNNPRRNDKAVKPVMESLKEFGWKQPIVIDKDNVIVCGHTRLRADNVEAVDTDEVNSIIHVDKPTRNADHTTMKPIALCAKCIKNSCQQGDTVLDLFGGSGSTLIACEQINRQ